MELIFSAIIPIFMIIILGGIAERMKLLGNNSVVVLNRFVFHFAFPPLLFIILAEEPLANILNWPYIGALFGGMLGTFLLMLLYSRYVMGGTLSIASIRAQAAAFPNTGYIGLPLALAMLGEKALLPMGIAVILSMLILSMSIILIKVEKHRGTGFWRILREVLYMLVTNPVIIAPVLGMLFSATGWSLPIFIARFCHQLGAAAAPCALFAIGLSLAAQSIKPAWSEVLSINFFKLIFQPILTLIMMLLFHVPALWAVTGVMSATISTAAVTFMISQQYGILDRHIAAVIFYGTVGSIVTMSVFILLLPKIWPGLAFH